MNGTIAAHAPSMTSSTPLVAPRVHGTRILLSWTPRSEEANLTSWPIAVIHGLLASPQSIPTPYRGLTDVSRGQCDMARRTSVRTSKSGRDQDSGDISPRGKIQLARAITY